MIRPDDSQSQDEILVKGSSLNARRAERRDADDEAEEGAAEEARGKDPSDSSQFTKFESATARLFAHMADGRRRFPFLSTAEL